MKKTIGENVFEKFNVIILFVLSLITIYPCLYVLFASLSDPIELYNGSKLLLFPRGFSVVNYTYVIKNQLLWIGYKNTILYAAVGTAIQIMLSVMAAYCLSRKGLPGKNFLIMAMVFTMYFAGGMIPTFMVIKSLGLYDTWFAAIAPHIMNTYNFVIVLTYFKGMPYELDEAARIDGANDYRILFLIYFPLAKAVVAVVALYCIVAIWNDYMTVLLYINSSKLYSLQLVLREILFDGSMEKSVSAGVGDSAAISETIKYATMVVSTIPVLCIYPFIQKYFVKGVMIGAVKG